MTEDQKDRMLLACYIAFVMILFVLVLIAVASARNLDGRYAASPLKPWFDTLKSGNGDLCCSSADGQTLEDVDWEIDHEHYRVRIPSPRANSPVDWVAVPDSAVVKQPNLAGRTMVWPLYGVLGVTIRCFLAGSLG